MRKLIVQMQITLDGFVAGPGGELDWMSPDMDSRQTETLHKLTNNIDTILLGRKMTEGFVTHWENVANNEPDSPEYPYARIFVDTPKIVFSKTVKSMKGNNLTVENGDLTEVISRLKNTPGKHIIVYGGANFVSGLILHELIDELYLVVNPVALAMGLRIFNDRV
ncbi:MAG: deaminase, partial [Chitinophagaceae bacterium]